MRRRKLNARGRKWRLVPGILSHVVIPTRRRARGGDGHALQPRHGERQIRKLPDLVE